MIRSRRGFGAAREGSEVKVTKWVYQIYLSDALLKLIKLDLGMSFFVRVVIEDILGAYERLYAAVAGRDLP